MWIKLWRNPNFSKCSYFPVEKLEEKSQKTENCGIEMKTCKNQRSKEIPHTVGIAGGAFL